MTIPLLCRTATPFSKSGALDEDALRQYLQRFIDTKLGVYLGSGGTEGGARPAYESRDLLEWSWTTVPASPIKFTYNVSVPPGTTGDQVIASLVTSQAAGTSFQTMAKPDPLVLHSASGHSADSNRDGKISLVELTRVIELYNTRSGTTRSGRCA